MKENPSEEGIYDIKNLSFYWVAHFRGLLKIISKKTEVVKILA